MKHFLISTLLMVLSTCAGPAFAQVYVEKQSVSGTNQLKNAGFEQARTNWTLTGGTPSFDTSVNVDGIQSLKLTMSAYTGTLIEQSWADCSKVQGLNVKRAIHLKSAQSGIVACALDGATEKECQPLTASNLWLEPVFHVKAPSSGSCGIRVKTVSAVTGDLWLDSGYVGLAPPEGIQSSNYIKNGNGDNGTTGWFAYDAYQVIRLGSGFFTTDFPVGTPVYYTTSGTAAGGLTANTQYYVADVGVSGTGQTRLATSVGGTAINLSSAGTGTHYLRAAIPYGGSVGAAVSNQVAIEATDANPIGVNAKHSLLLQKTASANSQGAGWYYDFDIPVGQKASVQQVSFSYTVPTGTFDAGSSNIAPGDITVWIWDRTNSKIIPVQRMWLGTNSTTIAGHISTTFQAEPNSTAYRLLFHIASQSTSTFTIKMGAVEVRAGDRSSPSPAATIAIRTTSARTMNNTSPAIVYEIVDRDTLGGYNPSTGIFKVSEAGWYLISGYFRTSNSTSHTAGQFAGLQLRKNGALTSPIKIIAGFRALANFTGVLEGSGAIVEYFAAGDEVAIGGYSDAATTTFASDNRIEITKIAGAGSGGSGQLVNFVGTPPSQTMTTANTTPLSLNVLKDTTGSWSTNSYTVKVPGDYQIMGALVTTASGSVAHSIAAHVNGAFKTGLGANPGVIRFAIAGTLNDLKVGDVITLRSDGTSVAVTAVDFISITRVSTPSNGNSANQTFAVTATNSTGQSIPNAATTTITGWTVTRDSSNLFSPSTGIFTAQVAGWYYAKLSLAISQPFTANVGGYQSAILASSGQQSWSVRQYGSNTGTDGSVSSSDLFYLLAGQTLTFAAWQNNGTARSLLINNNHTSMSVYRIGN